MKSVEPVKSKVAYTVLEWSVTGNAVGKDWLCRGSI